MCWDLSTSVEWKELKSPCFAAIKMSGSVNREQWKFETLLFSSCSDIRTSLIMFCFKFDQDPTKHCETRTNYTLLTLSYTDIEIYRIWIVIVMWF